MNIRKLSLIIPCYNEESQIIPLLEKLKILQLDHDIQKEIILVNDGSTDQTEDRIKDFQGKNPSLKIEYIRHDRNTGKGACIRSGLEKVTGEVMVVQDADQEYDPMELNRLIKPIKDEYADVVYGSRFRGSDPHRILFFWHTVGNKFLTFLSNLFTGLNLTDMETGYKMVRMEIMKNITLKECRYGFEPEITARLSKVKNIRIYEVGISYYGRTYEEGKKIRWKDGLKTIYCIFKYNLF